MPNPLTIDEKREYVRQQMLTRVIVWIRDALRAPIDAPSLDQWPDGVIEAAYVAVVAIA